MCYTSDVALVICEVIDEEKTFVIRIKIELGLILCSDVELLTSAFILQPKSDLSRDMIDGDDDKIGISSKKFFFKVLFCR